MPDDDHAHDARLARWLVLAGLALFWAAFILALPWCAARLGLSE